VALTGSEHGLEDHIRELPSTLDQIYDAMLTRHPNDELKRALLSILVAARRPLTIGEVQVTLKLSQTDPNDVHKSVIWRLNLMKSLKKFLETLADRF
jgi:hypothetical protein